MDDINICLDNPLFFIPIGDAIDNSRPFSLPLPPNWDEIRGKEWTNLYPLNKQIQRQGWKVHISSELDTTEQVLLETAKVCFKYGVVFKHLTTMKAFKNRNGKLIPRAYSGKFITCYPTENILESFLNSLEDSLENYKGPYILSDKRWKDGPIYLRYGVFKSDGETPKMLLIDNKMIEDERKAKFIIPKNIEIPLFLKEWIENDNHKIEKELPFRINSPIRFSNNGGIYRVLIGENFETKAILKEARPYTGIDNEGIYAPNRLICEEQALDLLSKTRGVPSRLWSGKIWEHEYLAIEQMPGITLNRWVTNNFPIYDKNANNYLKNASDIIEQLIKIITEVHEKNIYHQDIHLGNILIDENNKISIIDWEQVVFCDSEQLLHEIAAPGFGSWGENCASEIDWYGLTQVAHYLFYPLIIQSELVYAYGEQTVHAGISLYQKLNFKDKDISKYLKQLKSLKLKTKKIEITSLNKILHPYIKYDKKELIENTSFEGFAICLLKGIAPILKNWRYEHRLFPVHFFGITDNLGIAYSDLGIMWSYSKLLHSMKIEYTNEFRLYEKEIVLESIKNIKLNDERKYGLFDGVSGSVWLLSELYSEEKSAEIFNELFEKMLIKTRSFKMYDGIAGVLLVGLYFFNKQLLTKQSEKLLLNKLQDFSEKYQKNPSEFIPIRELKNNSNNPYEQAGGLLYGHAGIGWLFGEANRVTGKKEFIDSLNVAIQFELKNYKVDKIKSLQYSEGERLLPYFSMGSAGLGILISQNSDLVKDEYLDKLSSLYKALTPNFCRFPGLFNGFVGLEIAKYIISDSSESLNLESSEKELIEGLHRYLINIGDGVCVAGDSGLRITMDVASGFGGVALAISSILDNDFYMFPKIERR